MRARMALAFAQVEVELREVELKNKPQALLDVSPQKSVPVLVPCGGCPMDDSVQIAAWALAQHTPENWLIYDEQQAEIAQQFIDENNGEFKQNLDRYKYATRFPEQPMEVYRAAVEVFLRKLDDQLISRTFLLGEQPSLADICIFPFIRQCAFVDKDWFDQTPYRALQHWLTLWLNSPVFQAIMVKIPPWQEGDEPLLYLPYGEKE